MSTQSAISLVPLALEWHVDALQQVYGATPGYWEMYNFPATPAGQAEYDLRAATETPGRTLLGIVRQIEGDEAATTRSGNHSGNHSGKESAVGAELVGLIDFRLHWPDEQVVYIGMVMVAEPYQRQGIGTQAWTLLKPWLAQQAQMQRARLAVEQFNPNALKFFESLGFTVTGDSNRIKVGDKFVRLLYMEAPL